MKELMERFAIEFVQNGGEQAVGQTTCTNAVNNDKAEVLTFIFCDYGESKRAKMLSKLADMLRAECGFYE